MNKQTIKLGNKYYDAITGAQIPDQSGSPHDHDRLQNHDKKTETKVAMVSTSKPALHTVKPSQTLMRSAVKRPVPVQSRTIKVQTVAEPTVVAPKIIPKSSVTRVSQDRLVRANLTLRHEKISRFSGVMQPPSPTQFAHVPVQPAPATKPEEVPLQAPEPKRTNEPFGHDMFTNAIAAAQHHVDIKSYTAAYKRRAKHHFASMSLGVTALLVIVGFAVFLNSPQLQIHVAGIRAGVTTSGQDYSKAGFAFVGVEVEDSKRVLYLKDTQGERYKLTEQATSWGEKDMLANVASHKANGAPNYTVMKIDDQKVYHFDTGASTWIKNGTWYSLGGTANLSPEQLERLIRNV